MNCFKPASILAMRWVGTRQASYKFEISLLTEIFTRNGLGADYDHLQWQRSVAIKVIALTVFICPILNVQSTHYGLERLLYRLSVTLGLRRTHYADTYA